MTEERKEYMTSISKEELAIRLKIVISKSRIKLLKQFMVVDKYDDELIREEKQTIAQEKIFIKNLKKQLPAPRGYARCKVCGAVLIHWDGDKSNYCTQCGQKLR